VSLRYLPVAVALLLWLPAVTRAQDRPTLFTLAAGASRYDIAITGTTWVAAMRSPVMAGRAVVVEPGITFFTYLNQINRRTNLLLPELSIQGSPLQGRFRPYLGGGIGFSTYLSGPNRNDLTLHAVAGARFVMSNTWALTAETRARTIDPFTNHTIDFTVGFTRASRGRF
jgi:hypothetical protein